MRLGITDKFNNMGIHQIEILHRTIVTDPKNRISICNVGTVVNNNKKCDHSELKCMNI